jgi:hypothetical protein
VVKPVGSPFGLVDHVFNCILDVSHCNLLLSKKAKLALPSRRLSGC